MPFRFALLGSDGTALPLAFDHRPPGRPWPILSAAAPAQGKQAARAIQQDSWLLELNQTHTKLVIKDVPQRPVPVLNMDLTAPVLVHYPWTEEERATVMASSICGSAAFDAAQGWFRDLVVRVARGAPMTCIDRFVSVCERLMADTDARSPALLAHIFASPTEMDMLSAALASGGGLSASIQGKDNDGDTDHALKPGGDPVERLISALFAVRAALGERLEHRWLRLYDLNQVREPYQPDPEQSGKRALARVALFYLMHLAAGGNRPNAGPNAKKYLELAEGRYRFATNMTERIAVIGALNVTASLEGPPTILRSARQRVLDDFRDHVRPYPTAMDKYFAFEGRYAAPGAIARIRAAMAHPDWAVTEPNKVRALLGSFVMANPLCFHAADGSGYDLLFEQIKKLNQTNPSLGARLFNAMQLGVRLGSERQQMIRTGIDSLCAQTGLSAEIREIAERIRSWSGKARKQGTQVIQNVIEKKTA